MSGFRKARKAVPIAHARVGQHGHVCVATGCAALDRLVGGGLALGTVLLVGSSFRAVTTA